MKTFAPIATTLPGWLSLNSSGVVECIPAHPDGPIDLDATRACTHGNVQGCQCEVLSGDPELRLDLTGAGGTVRPTVALHVRGDAALAGTSQRTRLGRRRLAGVAVSPLCDRCLDGRQLPRFADGMVGEEEWPGLLRPLCSDHAEGRQLLTIEEVDARCGVDVVIASPAHMLVQALLVDHRARFPQPPFPIQRDYATDLEVGDSGRVFIEHVRIDTAGRYWLATWARVVAGLPGVDVPIRRLVDGTLQLDLSGVRLRHPIRSVLPGDPERGFVVEVATSGRPMDPSADTAGRHLEGGGA